MHPPAVKVYPRERCVHTGNRTPKVLDVGCGSGILSIVALKLGASAVVGTDLDPDCMTSTHENMEVNHLDPSLGTFYVGNLIDDAALQEKVGTEEYDIVVANILADVIIPMAPVIPARLKRGGYFITSGIIDFKENADKRSDRSGRTYGGGDQSSGRVGEHYGEKAGIRKTIQKKERRSEEMAGSPEMRSLCISFLWKTSRLQMIW